MSDTIAAVATGNVVSAIGILRVSGAETLSVIDRVFFPANGKPMSESEDRKFVYGALKAADGSVLDLCLCTISRAPHSYTSVTARPRCCARVCTRSLPPEPDRRSRASFPDARF